MIAAVVLFCIRCLEPVGVLDVCGHIEMVVAVKDKMCVECRSWIDV